MLAVFRISHRMGVKLGERWFEPYIIMRVTKPGLRMWDLSWANF